MVALVLAMALSGLFFLSLILFHTGCWPWPCQDSFLGPDFESSANDNM